VMFHDLMVNGDDLMVMTCRIVLLGRLEDHRVRP
jgi:hypothetical protein